MKQEIKLLGLNKEQLTVLDNMMKDESKFTLEEQEIAMLIKDYIASPGGNKLNPAYVTKILDNSKITYKTEAGKMTVAIAVLPNNFVIEAKAACVAAENYDIELGKQLAYKKLEDKVYELEGYILSSELYGGVINE